VRHNLGNLDLPVRLGVPWISESETQSPHPCVGNSQLATIGGGGDGHLLVFQKDE
jgi:hypothetical protein